MVSVEELLDEMDAILDKATPLPLSGGRAMVNIDRLKELIDDIRLRLPQEIRKARAIVTERNDILADARKEAESITRKAEDRARSLVNEDEIVRKANITAGETISQAQAKGRDIRKAAVEYSENIMRATEDIISQKLTELRQARQNLRSSVRSEGSPSSKDTSASTNSSNDHME